MPDPVEAILSRTNGKPSESYLMGVMYAHRPFIKRGGDQRDPTEEIACTCKKTGNTYESLDVPFYIHLFDVVTGYVKTVVADDGR